MMSLIHVLLVLFSSIRILCCVDHTPDHAALINVTVDAIAADRIRTTMFNA